MQARPATQVSLSWFIPSDYVATLDNNTFAIFNRQPNKKQGGHWIVIAEFRHKVVCRLSWT